MKLRAILMAGAMAAGGLASPPRRMQRTTRKSRCCTGGRRAARRRRSTSSSRTLAKEGYTWKDVPVAGGGGEARDDDAEGDGRGGQSADRLADPRLLRHGLRRGRQARRHHAAGDQEDDWAKVIPTALQKFTTTDGKWGAVPVNIHSVNWIWLNKAVMEKIGGTEPKNFDELDRSSRQGQGGRRHPARARRPALAGSDDVRLGRRFDRRHRLLQEGVHRPRRERAQVGHDEEGFDNLAKLRGYIDPNYAGRDWNLATAMVIKGDALVQVMGDWAKGEFKNANKEAGKDYPLLSIPRHRRVGDLQHRHVRHVPGFR